MGLVPYLDHAASSLLRPVAREALLAALAEPGNAASLHAAGRRAARRADAARGPVAALFGRPASEVVWTSGGTESANLAILGAPKGHTLVSAVEHRAVLGPARTRDVELLPVDEHGVVVVAELARRLRPDTTLVSVMAVNNETGAVQPLAELAELAHAHGALFHTDAAQAAFTDLTGLDADLISLSAHKIGGPPGVGALLVRKGTPLGSIMFGGAHERGLRPGTVNAAGAAAFAAAAGELLAERSAQAARLTALRERLASHVLAGVPGARRVGAAATTAPQILCLAFPGLEGEALVLQLDLAEVAASSGAACTTLGQEPSHVLAALGLEAAAIAGSLRLSLGWSTAAAEVDEAAGTVVRVVNGLLQMRPMEI